MNTKSYPRRRMLQCMLLLLCITSSSVLAKVAQAAPLGENVVGLWRVIDDDSHLPISLIAICEQQGKLMGTVMRVMRSSQGEHPVCQACEGERKNKAVVGMTVLWDLKEQADRRAFGEGFVLDPAKGKIYRAKLKLISPDRLEVRGYLGISLFGRTQVWERAKPSDLTDPIAQGGKPT